MLSHYAPGSVIFDLAPPLKHEGSGAGSEQGLKEWFATWQGPIGHETRDVSITANGDVAYCHGLIRISGTKVGGEHADVWAAANHLPEEDRRRLENHARPYVGAVLHGWQLQGRRRFETIATQPGGTRMRPVGIDERETPMESIASNSKAARWTGYAMSGLVILFLLFDGGIKLVPLEIVTQTSGEIGLPTDPSFARLLGILTLIGVVLYAMPQTAVLGAILLTGYMGGAIATHLRIDSPLFSHTLFGVYLGLLIWGGLYLREPRLRALIPFRR